MAKENSTESNLKQKIDDLVSDFNNALDDFQTCQPNHKLKSFHPQPKFIGAEESDESENSISSNFGVNPLKNRKSSIPLSDSDEAQSTLSVKLQTSFSSSFRNSRLVSNVVESDSVNENIASQFTLRRKHKFKQINSVEAVVGTSIERTPCFSLCGKRKPRLLVSAGKRKRARDKSEYESFKRCSFGKQKCSGSIKPSKLNFLNLHKPTKDELMDLSYENCSESASSSDGVATCDEGREADDEQSDWFAEPGSVYGIPGMPNLENSISGHRERSCYSIIQNTDKGIEEKKETSEKTAQTCRLRFQKLRERLLRREIMAGKRRLQDRRPSFSIISSVNDKVSRFLQNPCQSELRLRPMSDKDRSQLWHLARLYSLNLRSSDDLNAPILTKTRRTISTTRHDSRSIDPSCASHSMKRRRRCITEPSINLTEGSNDSTESLHNLNSSGISERPPVPKASWGGSEGGNYCADSNSERLADSEPDTVPSPTMLALQQCTL